MASLVSSIGSNLATALDLTDNVIDSIQTYLEAGNTTAGKLIHWSLMTASSALANDYRDGITDSDNSFINKTVQAISTINAAASGWNVASSILDYVSLPNLEGIPIYVNSLDVSREVDVSEDVYIVQKDSSTNYVMNSSVPHLRKWNLEGYLQTLFPRTDQITGSHESLELQEKLIDYFSQARRPMWFKTHQNEFVQVMISSYSYSYVPENQNATKISLSLVEYKALELAYGSVTGSNSAIKSVVQKVTSTVGSAISSLF